MRDNVADTSGFEREAGLNRAASEFQDIHVRFRAESRLRGAVCVMSAHGEEETLGAATVVSLPAIAFYHLDDATRGGGLWPRLFPYSLS